MPENEQEAVRVIESLTYLLGDQETQVTLKDPKHYTEAMQKLNLSENLREPILHLLSRFDRMLSQAGNRGKPVSFQDQGSKTNAQDDSIEKKQLEAFDHIRVAFLVSMAMSVGLFMVGLVLIGFALYEALKSTSISISALTIGGLGLADFVVLFLRRPWRDVSVNLSNSQQVRTIATTYLSGLWMIQQGDTKRLDMLDELTKRTVTMLEEYAEEPEEQTKKPIP